MLTKFGASELNERFLRSAERPMTSSAWIAWLAVKCLVDVAFRPPGGVPLLPRLRKMRMDGHKGAALWFDASQLQQPLYVVGLVASSESGSTLLADGAAL